MECILLHKKRDQNFSFLTRCCPWSAEKQRKVDVWFRIERKKMKQRHTAINFFHLELTLRTEEELQPRKNACLI